MNISPPNDEQENLKLYKEVLEFETKESLESARWLATQIVSVVTILAVADLTAVGYAAGQNKAGIFLIGAIISTMMFLAYCGGAIAFVPIICRLKDIERDTSQMLHRRIETSFTLVMLVMGGEKFIREIDEINKIESKSLYEKRRAMRKLSDNLLLRNSPRFGTYILLLAILSQILAIPVLIYFFHWNLF